MGRIKFTKMHGCGNDYIYVDTMQYPIADPVKEAQENKLLGYWKLDAENRGKDLTGNGYDGQPHGGISYTEANIRCPE